MSKSISTSKLKRKIKNINNDNNLSLNEKRQKIQEVMMYNWNNSENKQLYNLDENEISYYNKHLNILGCEHYQKKCKILYKCCNKWYVCRCCHDEHEDHITNRYQNEILSCMECNTIQHISNKCKNCKLKFAKYYCKYCNYHNNNTIDIYHCKKCKICNIGLKQDFKHCEICDICISKDIFDTHICKLDQFNIDCPVCKLCIKGSKDSAYILENCKHILHNKCFEKYIQTNYKCPICVKSIHDFNISTSWFLYFNEILKYEKNQIPEDHKNTMVRIYCNDCERKSETTYHFEIHQCEFQNCLSYNTSIISIHTDYYDNDSSTNDESFSENSSNETNVNNIDILITNDYNSDSSIESIINYFNN